MDAFRIVALLTIAFIDCSLGATKSKCDVVNALKAEGVPDADMRDCKYKRIYFNVNVKEYAYSISLIFKM
jgi:hypothetical protein